MWVSALRKSLDITFCGKWMKCRVKVYCWQDHSQFQDAMILNATDPWQRQGLPLVQIQMLASGNTASSFIILTGCSLTLDRVDRHPIQIGCPPPCFYCILPTCWVPRWFCCIFVWGTDPSSPTFSVCVPVVSSSPITRVKSSPHS